jgi:hypothetical protein
MAEHALHARRLTATMPAFSIMNVRRRYPSGGFFWTAPRFAGILRAVER